MLLSFASFESLDEQGRIDSFFIFPTDARPVIGDVLSDIRGDPRSDDVDLGPLRLYTDEQGIRVRRTVTDLSRRAFLRAANSIELNLEHGPLAVSEHTGGFYSLLLPHHYCGQVQVSEDHDIQWLEDEERLLVSVKLFRAWNAPPLYLRIHAALQYNARPHPDIPRINSTEVYADWDAGPRHNGVRAFVRAANASLSKHAPSAFLCHSSADKEFVRRLAISLAGEGINIWIDEAEILVGDSLIDKIEQGIFEAEYLVAILSKNSVNSRWCREELKMAIYRQLAERHIKVLPVLIDDSAIPGFLQEKVYADFRDDRRYFESLHHLCNSLRGISPPKPIPEPEPTPAKPTCPYCGGVLASHRARLCLHCGKKWFHLEPGEFPDPSEERSDS